MTREILLTCDGGHSAVFRTLPFGLLNNMLPLAGRG